MRAGRRVLFEGAQGTLLDIDHGTYPYVTSSNASIGGVCTGLGVPPAGHRRRPRCGQGLRHPRGRGPVRPRNCSTQIGERLRETGQEYGASTGRPRRCGWYDAVAVRYAARVNGIDALALTKLDVLDGLEEIQVAVAYRIDGQEVREFPATLPNDASVVPVYESWPGWTAPTRGATTYDALPTRRSATSRAWKR